MAPLKADPAPLVLVVDDEPGVLLFMEKVLAGAGYAVHVAPSAAQALELLPRLPKRPALLVSDVHLQPVSGLGLAELMLHSSPSTRILFVSGYPVPEHRVSGGPLLRKPFSPEQLVEAVARLVRPSVPPERA